MKVQDPPNIAKAERTYQILTPHTSKSIALIQMDVGQKKTRSKISDLHG
jgi:hypothetical protein